MISSGISQNFIHIQNLTIDIGQFLVRSKGNPYKPPIRRTASEHRLASEVNRCRLPSPFRTSGNLCRLRISSPREAAAVSSLPWHACFRHGEMSSGRSSIASGNQAFT